MCKNLADLAKTDRFGAKYTRKLCWH